MTQSQLKPVLTWVPATERGRADWPRVRIGLADAAGGRRSGSYEAMPAVCANPRCGCRNLLFEFRGGKRDGEAPVSFWFDMAKGKTERTTELAADPVAARLAGALDGAFGEEAAADLQDWFLAEKLHLVMTTPPDEIGIEELPDASGGRMVSFTEVFSFGLAVRFRLMGEVWAVDEQYCVRRGCDCAQVALNFLRLTESGRVRTGRITDPPALLYDHGSGRIEPQEPGEPGSPDHKTLFNALKTEYPRFKNEVRLRHRLLQSLYLRKALAGNTAGLATDEAAPAISKPKTGRNDPCPCGSGKKYKRCCGG